ncbi:uncharacterized protein LOC141601311 [Silene latifolia]|uniref:uncharacterized protein LOC141601311 n=1 Tax=Silene latifolia TaxID=37657 RepID=UPI003D782BC9
MQEVKDVPCLQFDEDPNEGSQVAEVVIIEDVTDNEIEDIAWVIKRGKKSVVVAEEEENNENILQFTTEDTKEVVELWNNAIYCFVLGANPPWEVLQGFVHRIWQKHNVDRISFMPNGIFLVRFKHRKDKEAILKAGYFMFDNKPLIIRSWDVNVELMKEDVKKVSAWIRIHDLPLKFWGKCLPAIAGLVSKFQKAGQATMDKTRLGFARVMNELNVGQKLPSKVRFLDETGKMIYVGIEYKWKPSVCNKCKGVGHEMNTCRKGVTNKPVPKPVQQVWKPKPVAVKPVQLSTEQLKCPECTPCTSPARIALSHTSTPASPHKTGSYRAAVEGEKIPRVGIGKKVSLIPNLLMNNIGFWNVRGLNNVNKQKTVKWFIHNKDIGLFGLVETKINGKNVSNNFNTMLDGWCVTTNSGQHKGGRVWILWKPNLFDVMVCRYDAQFIHTRVTTRISQQQLWFTMVYACKDGIGRRDLWHKLGVIVGQCNGSWALAEDFNTVIDPTETLGANTKEADMDKFLDCISTCGITDIAATGAYYTCTNKQELATVGASTRVFSRLDRFMVNLEWMTQFPNMMAHFHPEGLFDHCPCTVSNSAVGDCKRDSFKYFNMWSKEDAFIPTVTK